jgi:prevent-host-death family protein
MKRPALAQDLVPVHEFRSNMASWMKQLEETGRPVVLTQRGRAAAVLVDPAMLDEIEETRDVVKAILEGLEDAEAGRLSSDEEVWDQAEAVIAKAEKKRARQVD